mgnify:CR=1 FL=1
MNHLLFFISLVITSCGTPSPEQQLIDAFGTSEEYSGVEPYSILKLGTDFENYLLNNGHLTSITQKDYFELFLKVLKNEIEIDEQDIMQSLPNSWILFGPSVTATVLKYPNKIIDDNPGLSPEHPIRVLTEITNKIAQGSDLGDIDLNKQLIFSIPEEFKKLHYHIATLTIIRRIIYDNSLDRR